MNNWKGPKPLRLWRYEESLKDRLGDLLKKYEDLGFSKLIHL